MKLRKHLLWPVLGLLAGCNPCPPQPVCGLPPVKSNLESVIPPAERSLYAYESTETDDTIVSSLRLRRDLPEEFLSSSKLQAGVLTGSYGVRTQQDSSLRVYKSILTESDTAFAMTLMDGKGTPVGSVSYRKLPLIKQRDPREPSNPCDDPGCHQYFADSIYPGLLQYANRHCRTIRYCYGCPRNNPCVYYMVAIQPRSIRCKIKIAQLMQTAIASVPDQIQVSPWHDDL